MFTWTWRTEATSETVSSPPGTAGLSALTANPLSPRAHCETSLAPTGKPGGEKEIASAIADFILAAREGARLTLHRNREGFTLQVTGEVQRGGRGAFDLGKVKELRRLLDRLGDHPAR